MIRSDRILPSPPRSFLAAWLAVWAIAVVYVTLYPLSGWRAPGVPLLAFLTEPWPRYWTRLDLAQNVAAYLPLGVLGTTWLSRRLRPTAAAAAAVLVAALLSCALEAMQTLLPARISSLPDMLANSAGALAGALLVIVLGPQRITHRLRRLAQNRMLARGSGPGVLLLALWLAVQWHPQLIAFASGELAPLFESPGIPALAALRPPLGYQPLVEASVVAATTLAIGLITRELLRRQSGWAVAAPLLLGAAAKSWATVNLHGAGNALAWLTAGAQGGLLAGALLLALSIWWRPRWRLAAAIAALACATVLANLAPVNAYFQATLAGWDQGGWANVNALLRAVALVWPFAAIGWCALRLRALRGCAAGHALRAL